MGEGVLFERQLTLLVYTQRCAYASEVNRTILSMHPCCGQSSYRPHLAFTFFRFCVRSSEVVHRYFQSTYKSELYIM